jgi:(5-formylfuran-3-yl)methyl phosphate synthase
MTRLLVSVRSAVEAEAALEGGAALIDVKEPALGALGRADDATIADVARVVAERAPVSAALGELRDIHHTKLPLCLSSLAFVKCGLAGCMAGDGWRSELDALGEAVKEADPHGCMVAVAYADWRRARAPAPDDVCAFVCQRQGWGLLLDTWAKDGLTLLDWMSRVELDWFCRACHSIGAPIALAGSLGHSLIRTLKPTAPDWFAVRGAACHGLQRTSVIDPDKVRDLVDLINAPVMGAICAGRRR